MSNDRRPLSELEQSTDFAHRHIGPSAADIAAMLETLGMKSLDELVEKAVPPPSCRRRRASKRAAARPRCWPTPGPWRPATRCSSR